MWHCCKNIVFIVLLYKYSLAQLIPISPLKPVAHMPKRFFSYSLTLFNSPPLIFLFFYHCYYLFFSFFLFLYLIFLVLLFSSSSFLSSFLFFSFPPSTAPRFLHFKQQFLPIFILSFFFSSLFSLDSYWLCSPYSKSMEI